MGKSIRLNLGKSYIGKTKTRISKNLNSNDYNKLSDIELELVNSMITIWNEVMVSSKQKISFNKNLADRLLAILPVIEPEIDLEIIRSNNVTSHEKLLGIWKGYCLKINSSKFLMGERNNGYQTFIASIWFVTKADIAKKVLSGEYGIGDRVTDIQAKLDADNAKQARELSKSFWKKKLEALETETIFTKPEQAVTTETFSIKVDESVNEADKNSSLMRSEFEAMYRSREAAKKGVSEEYILVNWSNPILSMQYEAFKSQYYKKQQQCDLYGMKTTENIVLGKESSKLYDISQVK